MTHAGEVAAIGSAALMGGIADDVVRCTACPRLVAWRTSVADGAPDAEEYWSRPLPGFGDPDARLVVVGLAPAAHGGNRTGRVFTGDRSGDFLFAALWRAGFANQPTSTGRGDGLVLRDAYVTSAVRCAPPENKPTPAERDRCRPFLEAEFVALGRRRVTLALGAFGFDAVLGVLLPHRLRPKPRFAHGGEVALPDGTTLVGVYHPSQRNVFTGLLTPQMYDDALERVRALLDATP